MSQKNDIKILLNYYLRKSFSKFNINTAYRTGKINLNEQRFAFFGKHRSGLKYAVDCLKPLHNPQGILFDAMIERTFVWHPTGPKIYKSPWIGIIHVPPIVPQWFDQRTTNEAIFHSKEWQLSSNHCLGIFTLSEYHKKHLQSKIDIPVNTLILPTEEPKLKWSIDKFLSNNEKKIVQVGWWLRKLNTIFQLPVTNYKKALLKLDYVDIEYILKSEREYLIKSGESDFDTNNTLIIPFLNNRQYDKLLSENLVILNLWDSSLNNAIIECIIRTTPLLINKIEPVIEYLGANYPLYFDSLDEAAYKAENTDLIFHAHQYLNSIDITKKLKKDYFLNSFATSEIYLNL